MRPLRTGLAVLLMIGAWLFPGAASFGGVSERDLAQASSGRVIAASDFANSLGVNVHLNFEGTPYKDLAAVERALRLLGIRNLRDLGAQDDMTAYEALARQGYRFNFFLSAGQVNLATTLERLSAFAAAYPGAIVSLEGPNEVNNWPVTFAGRRDFAAAKAYQQAFFHAAADSPRLRGIPVANLSLGADKASTYAPLGDMSAAADYGNAHIYFSYGSQPGPKLPGLLAIGRTPTPGKRMMVTETGYSSLASDSFGVDEATHAKFTLNLLMDNASSGIVATYLYELVDNTMSGGGAWDHVGLFRSDWTPKPAALAVHNLLSILTRPGPANRADPPRYTISGLGERGAHLVFRRPDGGYAIVLWAEPDIWDAFAHRPVPATARAVTLRLSSPVAGYRLYDPLIGETPVDSGVATSALALSLLDHPLVIELGAQPDGGTGERLTSR